MSTTEGLRVAEAGGADHLLHFVGVDIDWARDGGEAKRQAPQPPSGWDDQ